jgi:hypothetical protein
MLREHRRHCSMQDFQTVFNIRYSPSPQSVPPRGPFSLTVQYLHAFTAKPVFWFDGEGEHNRSTHAW